MTGISEWYPALGEFSFPTVFLELAEEERRALIEQDDACKTTRDLSARLQKAIRSLGGAGFIGTDVCAPTDSPKYRHGRWVSFGRTAWRVLAGSHKARAALSQAETRLLTVRPWRRMDRAREFRLFVHQRKLAAISQLHLDRYLPGIAQREREILGKTRRFLETVAERLPEDNLVMDVYLTAEGELMLVDINDWGPPTDPLLLRKWDRDWTTSASLVLVPEPVRMGGDISISF